MVFLSRTLLILVVLELAGFAVLIAQRFSRPLPPRPNLERLEAATAAELRALAGALSDDDPRQWHQLGEAYMAYGFFPEAEWCFQKASELDGQSFPIRYSMAYCLARMGRTQEAIDGFRRAAELADDHWRVNCWYHIGRNYLREENPVEAERAFRKAPEFPPSAYLLAKTLARTGRTQEAVRILNELASVNSFFMEPYRLLAQCEQELGNLADAAKHQDLAERTPIPLVLEDSRQPVREQFGLQRQLAESRKVSTPAASNEAIHKIVMDNEWWATFWLVPATARAEVDLGHADRAIQLLTELFKHSNVTSESLEIMGDALRLKGQDDEAFRMWEHAARIQSNERLHSRMAGHYERRNDGDTAKRHRAMALYWRGVEAFRNNNMQGALSALNESVQLDLQHAASWFYLGETLRVLSRMNEARESYERCLKINPHHGRALSRLGRISKSE